jgi:hypothetical protein
MDLFGIQLTWGHLIVAGLGILAYDAIWTWVFTNHASDWWFERLQGYLKLGIYAGIIGSVALLAYTPWPVNLIIASSAVVCILAINFWLKRRPKKRGAKKDEVPAGTR